MSLFAFPKSRCDERTGNQRESLRKTGSSTIRSLLVLAFTLLPSYPAQPADSLLSISETISFAIQHRAVPIQRAKRIAVLDSNVRLTYAQGTPPSSYPDSLKVAPEILAFLQSYPDKNAYYEVMARALAESILTKYAVVYSVEVKLEIEPDESRSYRRVATAVLARAPIQIK